MLTMEDIQKHIEECDGCALTLAEAAMAAIEKEDEEADNGL